MGRKHRDSPTKKNPTHGVATHTVGRDLTRQVLLLEELGVGAPHQAAHHLGSSLEGQAPRMSGFENQQS